MKSIKEMTTSASSGSFETPMGSGMVKRNFHPFYSTEPKKKKKKKNKKKMKNITISEIEKIVQKALIFEEVYSEKPIEPKGKEISSKNMKSEKTYNSNAGKTTAKSKVKSGEDHKKDISDRTEKVKASTKNNVKDAEVKDVNKDKKVNDDYETEAYQNGMEDTEYENISDEQKEKIKDQIKSPEMRKNPNAEKTGKAAEKMINQVKKRKDSKETNPMNTIARSGPDMEFIPEKKKRSTPRKKTAVSENIIKRVVFKEEFRDDKDMIGKIPSKYKENDKIFEMFDGDNKYRVRWEGNSVNGVPVILEHFSEKKFQNDFDFFKKLNEMDSKDNTDETLSESIMFKTLLNHSREIGKTMNNG